MNDWQPISTAPEGISILAWWPHWGFTEITYWDRERDYKRPQPHWATHALVSRRVEERAHPPTHWMHLPAPPKVTL